MSRELSEWGSRGSTGRPPWHTPAYCGRWLLASGCTSWVPQNHRSRRRSVAITCVTSSWLKRNPWTSSFSEPHTSNYIHGRWIQLLGVSGSSGTSPPSLVHVHVYSKQNTMTDAIILKLSWLNNSARTGRIRRLIPLCSTFDSTLRGLSWKQWLSKVHAPNHRWTIKLFASISFQIWTHPSDSGMNHLV